MSASPVNGKQIAFGDDVAHVVGILREQVLALSEQATRAPSTVRISARGVEIELGWEQNWEAAPVRALARPAAPALPAEPVAPAAPEPGTFSLSAGLVGVFYRAPEPGAKPFVAEGDVVRAGQQVAIIEAMKLMIPVEADRSGRVVEVLVTDGESVEHGQPLLLLEPEGDPA